MDAIGLIIAYRRSDQSHSDFCAAARRLPGRALLLRPLTLPSRLPPKLLCFQPLDKCVQFGRKGRVHRLSIGLPETGPESIEDMPFLKGWGGDTEASEGLVRVPHHEAQP